MSVIATYLLPHPPIILPEIGKGEERHIEKTTQSFIRASKEIAALNPDTIVFVTPHGINYSDYFSMPKKGSYSISVKNLNICDIIKSKKD